MNSNNASMDNIRSNMRFSGIVPVILLLFQSVMASAQSIDEIRQSPDFLSGTGTARSLRLADNDAIKNLSIEIAESAKDMFGNLDEVVYMEDEDSHQALTAIISTYYQSTLDNTGRIIVKQEPNAEVFRYLKLSDINKIFESRKNKVLDMLVSASKAEITGKIDDALRYYYWGYCLLQSLPDYNTITNETGKVLVEVSEDFYRPTDVVNLWGDPTKAKNELGWNPSKTTFEQLIKIMVDADMAKVAVERASEEVKMNLAEYLERGIVK